MSYGQPIRYATDIFESLVRDEIFCEKHLEIGNVYLSQQQVEIPDLISSENGYYTGAILITPLTQVLITGYNGNNKRVSCSWEYGKIVKGMPCEVVNIQGDRLDSNSLNIVGNQTNGTRRNWLLRRCINTEEEGISLLDSLLYEMWCVLCKENLRWFLIDRDPTNVVGQGNYKFWNPLKEVQPLVNVEYSDSDHLFSEYLLKYAYDPISSRYTKELYLSNKTNSSEAPELEEYRANCKRVVERYKVRRIWEYESQWHYNLPTAIEFFKRVVKFHTKVIATVVWIGSFNQHINYIQGDKVLIDTYLPSPLKQTPFIILKKDIIPIPGAPEIRFVLSELT